MENIHKQIPDTQKLQEHPGQSIRESPAVLGPVVIKKHHYTHRDKHPEQVDEGYVIKAVFHCGSFF
jgi:hypothetical protein